MHINFLNLNIYSMNQTEARRTDVRRPASREFCVCLVKSKKRGTRKAVVGGVGEIILFQKVTVFFSRKGRGKRSDNNRVHRGDGFGSVIRI